MRILCQNLTQHFRLRPSVRLPLHRRTIYNLSFHNRVQHRVSLRYSFKTQSRGLHAAWSILLNHYFLYVPAAGSALEETDLPAENVPTILFIHDAKADLNQCRSLAEIIIQSTESSIKSQNIPSVQCLLVDLRGSGMSDADDYDTPHTVQTATEDVIDLVAAVCPAPEIQQPSIVVAFGKVGSAVARHYLSVTADEAVGSLTKNTHSEVSGAGAVTPPSVLLLLPTNAERSEGDDPDADWSPYIYDPDVANDLSRSATTSSEEAVQVSADGVGRVELCTDTHAAVNLVVSILNKTKN